MTGIQQAQREHAFKKAVWDYYQRHGRHSLPWRGTIDPYRILVSEVMLQQTQVDRVIPKYREFLKWFPMARRLAAAPLGDVLRAWQGLGYNRRAKHLHECAKTVVKKHDGRIPAVYRELVELPAVGSYTANAILAFAYNQPVSMIETNIRTAYLHHFFPRTQNVSDKKLLPIIERTLDMKKPREWYYALMDYGAFLKKSQGNASRRSAHHTRQSKFEGSDRQIRGAILRALAEKPHTLRTLKKLINDERLVAQLDKLITEGMAWYHRRRYQLPK